MYDATLRAIKALKSYACAEEVSTDLASELCYALELLLAAASRNNPSIYTEWEAYLGWLIRRDERESL